jgi:hypothetical protein
MAWRAISERNWGNYTGALIYDEVLEKIIRPVHRNGGSNVFPELA